jgi:hypothetical protein
MDADNGLSTGGIVEETGEEVVGGWRGACGLRMDAGRESGRGEGALEGARGRVFCRRVGWGLDGFGLGSCLRTDACHAVGGRGNFPPQLSCQSTYESLHRSVS